MPGQQIQKGKNFPFKTLPAHNSHSYDHLKLLNITCAVETVSLYNLGINHQTILELRDEILRGSHSVAD
jgi:hypothetical protein